jgi:hypothetical protein
VGGQLEVFTRSFELLDADEYTYTYMENNKHIFIMADADAILSSLRVQVSCNMKHHSCTASVMLQGWASVWHTVC